MTTDPFAHRTPDEAQIDRIQALRHAYVDLLQEIETNAPAGRYRSLAITALEESCQWAVKQIVFEEKVNGS